MDTILAAILSIALGAPGALGVAAEVEGVHVARTSLTGYRVARQDGLTAKEAAAAVEALTVDAGWTAVVLSPPRCVPTLEAIRGAAAPVKAPKVKPAPSFYAKVQDAVATLRGKVVMNVRRSISMGPVCVIVSCDAVGGNTADQHRAAAKIVVQYLLNAGYRAVAEGSDVYVVA